LTRSVKPTARRIPEGLAFIAREGSPPVATSSPFRILTRSGGAVKAVVVIVIVLIVHCLTTPSIKERTTSDPLVEPTIFHTLLFHLTGKLGEPERLDEVLGDGNPFLRREIDASHHSVYILTNPLEEFRSRNEAFPRHLGHLHLSHSVFIRQTIQKLVDVINRCLDVLQCLGIGIGRRRHTNDER
jgi:hypothetical protein